MFRYLPPEPDFSQPPPLWGSVDHVLALFEKTGITLQFERQEVEFRFPSVDEALQIYETKWGPFIRARELLSPQGLWPALRAELAALLEQRNTSRGADLIYSGEYLVVLGKKPGVKYRGRTM